MTRLQIPFTRFPAALPPSDLPAYSDPELQAGHWACGLSHVLLLKQIYQSGIPRALILEDDAILRDDLLDQLDAARAEMDAKAWDLIYLGCHLVRDGPDASPADRLIQVVEAYHTHAYIVRREGIPKIIAAIGQRLGMMDGVFDGMRYPGLVRLRFKKILAIQEPGMGAAS